ncbi:MAG: glycosyltransferase family 4 protein [Candidatus Coproplasma sp.]
MKVLLVNKFHYMKGGSERYYFTLAEAFKARGDEVVFFAMHDAENEPCYQSPYFVSNVGVNGGIKSKLKMVLHIAYSKEAYGKMTELLKKENPDVVILNLVHKQITCSVIDAIKDYNPNIKILWTMHDLITVCPAYTMLDGKGQICEKCLDGNFNNCKKNKCIHGSTLMSYLSTYEAKKIKKKGWYNKVDTFICPSQFYADKLKSGNFTKSPIICLRNPLPLDTVYECNDHDDGYILYFGRLSPEKGVKTLIDASVQANVRLVVLGTGPIEAELHEYANDFANVEFKGFQKGQALTNYIKNARCVVLPSEWYENGPYSAMEAMALGKPLIVSNLGGLPELVEDGKNGYIFKTKEELAEDLKKITALSQEEYSAMCADSLNRAQSLFNPEQYIDKIKELI